MPLVSLTLDLGGSYQRTAAQLTLDRRTVRSKLAERETAYKK